jgi:two-component system phosphate regulon response regulator PhoB
MPHVLIVDDERDLAELIDFNLRAAGFSTRVAPTGESALSAAREQRTDVVLLDLMLPDMSGVEVCRQLRSAANTRDVLIVMLTAKGEESDRVRGFEVGADDYVTKPFSILELMARISALLRRAAPAPAAPPSAAAEPARPTPLSHEALRERFNLTARQIDVVRLLGEGFTNAEIAAKLEMSYYTARNHTEQVLSKLGVSSRAAVGALLYGQG